MKVTLATVVSIDGKLTLGDDPDISKWVSAEDQTHFSNLKASHSLLVMGRGTYEAMRSKLKLDPETLRIVVTSRPEEFASHAVKNQLEFTDEQPVELVERLEKNGYNTVLLVCGGKLSGAFMASGLVDEIYLTIEPYLFGSGVIFESKQAVSLQFNLISIKQLNKGGTMLIHYRFKR